MSDFATRLKELRLSKNKTQKQMADLFVITEKQYQRYEYGKSFPRVDDLCRLADFFGVSIDYLLDHEPCPTVLPPQISEFQKLFDKLNSNEQNAVIQMMKTLLKGKSIKE